MRTDGIRNVEGGKVVNLVLPKGDKFPDQPDDGELFRRTDLRKVYIYDGIDITWKKFFDMYDSQEVYTTNETDVKIDEKTAAMADTTPAVVSALTQLGDHLNNNPDAATALTSLLAEKVNRNGDIMPGVLEAQGFKITSLKNTKENIKPFTRKALDIIKGIDVVSYNYKCDSEKENKVGFIADNTDPIISGPNQDSMDTTNILGVLIRSVQELIEENKILKEKLA